MSKSMKEILNEIRQEPVPYEGLSALADVSPIKRDDSKGRERLQPGTGRDHAKPAIA